MIGMDRSSFDYQTWRGPLPEMPLSHSPYDTPQELRLLLRHRSSASDPACG